MMLKKEKFKKYINTRLFLALLFLLVVAASIPLEAQSCGAGWWPIFYSKGNAFRAIGNNGTIYVAVGDENLLWTSTDSINWTVRNPTAGVFHNSFDICYQDKFVVVGSKGFVMTSSNGTTWAGRNSKTSEGLWGITYGAGLYVACGNFGVVTTSPDGITWTYRGKITSENLTDVVYGGGQFVAVGSVGGIYTSPDGISWTKQTDVVGLIAAAYGGGVYVVGGRDGVIYTSTNGTAWVKRNTPTAWFVQDLVYTGSNFVAVGGYGIAMTSANGSTWTMRNSRAITTLMGVTFNSGQLVAVGLASTIVKSYCNPADATPYIQVNMPNKNLNWTGGATETITWTGIGMNNVKLEYSLDAGATYNTIAGSLANNGSYNWTIPNTPSSESLIRISDAADSNPSDESDSTFNILAGGGGGTNKITITSPNGGETLTAGSKYTIKWTSSTKFDSVDIEYYNGSTWVVIINGTPDDGSYSWTVPNISTTGARLWMKGWVASGNDTDYTDSTFTITGGAAPTNTITITYPNGGETLPAGSSRAIQWKTTGDINKVDIEYFDGNTWTVIINGTANDGSYTWLLPTALGSKYRLWIKGWGDSGNDTDYSDTTFTIGPSITVTSPNGGEEWGAGSSQNITWSTIGTVGNVKIEFSTNTGSSWTTITSSTTNDGSYPWNLPATQSTNCLVRITEVSGGQVSDASNSVFSIGGEPQLVLNRSQLIFGAVKGGAVPSSQDLIVSNGGGGTLNWTAASDSNWLTVSPSAASGNALVSVTVVPGSLAAGEYNGTITFSDPSAENSPQSVSVIMKIINSNQDKSPFGTFATPVDGTSAVTGSIAVTGWALDDVEVANVKIFREVNGQLAFIGNAVFVEGSRPDVEQAYPGYPRNYQAGWGYMLLTNFLPDGQLILKAVAVDISGNQVTLGTKTITVDNANIVKPFGAIDTPAQGGDASGSTFRNNGWALAAKANKIPVDGSTINVYIDSVFVGKATYNLYREDIANLFPGYQNSSGAWAYFDFDTTAYDIGVHTIEWNVKDNVGNNDGVGSRYFRILNVGASSRTSAITETGLETVEPGAAMLPARRSTAPGKELALAVTYPVDNFRPIGLKRGFGTDSARELHPDGSGILRLEIKELERIELHLGKGSQGCMLIDGEARNLPVGSTMDIANGIFSWQAAPGFYGDYQLMFITPGSGGIFSKREVVITIAPQHGN